MKEFKHVVNTTSKQGLMSSRVEVVMRKGTNITVEMVEGIAETVDLIVSGKTLILSGKEITVHGDVSAGGSMSNASILEKENESLRKQLKVALDENQGLANQRDKLQGILDSLDGVFQQVHLNSTRSALVRANSRNRYKAQL